MTATGSFTILSDNLTLIRMDGGNSFFAEVASLAYVGDLTGMATDTDTLVVYRDGSFAAHGTELCNPCTIGGRTGDLSSVFVFAGSGTQYAGHLTFTGGTGGLAGLHGEGTFQGNDSGNTYAYNYQFAP